MDGTAARGSRHDDAPAAHLLAVMTGAGQTVGQLRLPDRTNEVTCLAALLAPYDPLGVTVTADAWHTQREHARFLAEQKQAHYLLMVKANQPALFTALRHCLDRGDLPPLPARPRARAPRAPHGARAHRHRPAFGFPHAA
ncbi:transposase [Streptomyces sp. NPDC001070]